MKQHIAIIGPGRLGKVLHAALKRAGVKVSLLGKGDAPSKADAVIIAVQDQKIESVAKYLSGKIERGTIVLHLSGATGSDVLAKMKSKGCFTGSMHPLQSFPNLKQGLKNLPQTHWYCEGDRQAMALAKALIGKVKGVFHLIDLEQKMAYHAAVCMAANYMTTLVAAAEEIAAQIGIPSRQFRVSLTPILRATLENTLSLGPKAALTGPVARGDVAIVTAHIKSLKKLPKYSNELAELYDVLAEYTKKHVAG